MLDTSGVAWTRKNTWFQRGTTMLDTSGVAWTRKNTWFQPTRGGYLRCGRLGRGRAQDRPEAPGGQKVNESIADTNKLSTFRLAPQENPRRPMLDTPLGGVDTGKHVVPAQNHHVTYPLDGVDT